MIRGVTFTNQTVTAADDGVINRFLLGDGTISSNITYSGAKITISKGYIVICGRLIYLSSSESLTVSTSLSHARVRARIDLSGASTESEFGCVQFLLDYASGADAFDALTQGDINGGSATVYDLEMGVYAISSNGSISGSVRRAFSTPIVANSTIDSSKLVANAITASKIADSAVTNTKVASNAITTSKIYDGAVSGSKLATGAVTTDKIGDNAITTNKIANANVTEAKIASGAVSSTKLADGAITTNKVVDGAITDDKIAGVSGSKVTGTVPQATKLANTSAVGSATNPVYFNASGQPVKTTYTLGKSVPTDAKFTDTTYPPATTSTAGLMSAADKTKLDGIATGATKNTDTATTSTAGLMSAADKTKLDGIATGANKYTLPAATASSLGGVRMSYGTGDPPSSGVAGQIYFKIIS